MRNPKDRGFTLVEIMIVVAIIGLLASIAIPSLIRAKINASENLIKKDLKTFSTAGEMYRAAQIPNVYAPDIAALTSAVPPYLDITWNLNPRHDFLFVYAAAPDRFSMTASPASLGGAINTYCVDHTGVIVGSVEGLGAPAGGPGGCAGGTPIP